MLTLLLIATHAACLGAGWLGHKKYGKVADAVLTDVRSAPKP